MPFPHRLALHLSVMEHCALFGHRFVPNREIRVVHEGGGYHLQTNAAGYRCSRPPLEWRPASPSTSSRSVESRRRRVAVFGDSFTAGDGVDNAQRWTDRLQAVWDVDIYNFAVSGTGPDQNLMLAESLDLESFDLILWAMATHTVGRILMKDRLTLNAQGRIQRVARPHFVMSSGVMTLVPMPEGSPEPADAELVPASPTPDSRWRVDVVQPARLLGRAAANVVRRTARTRKDSDYENPKSPGWQLFSAIAERMIQTAGRTPLVIIPLPTRAHLRGELNTAYRERFRELEASRCAPRVLDVLEPMLVNGRSSRGKLAFDFDGHYTPDGHLALARAIASELRSKLGDVLVSEAPGVPEALPQAARPDRCHVVARWTLLDSEAKVDDARSSSSGAWRSESELTSELGVTGALPWSAIAAELDACGAFGSDVAEARLESPIDGATLAAREAPFDDWYEVAAAWVRWQGAAEIDLRQTFRITARVEHTVALHADLWKEAKHRAGESRARDAEEAWLWRRLRPIHSMRDATRRYAKLVRLATLWERTTRRARYSVLPLPPPGRERAVAATASSRAPRG